VNTSLAHGDGVGSIGACRALGTNEGKHEVKKAKLAGAVTVSAALAAILLPAPAASAVQVGCVDANFVKVTYHTYVAGGTNTHWDCFAGAGWNRFNGQTNFTSWMDVLHTGNNDVTYRDCNGTRVDYPRGLDVHFSSGVCISDIGIKPY
jgi:hypothetical protein